MCGDDQADQSGVRQHIPGRGSGVTGRVELGIPIAFGKATDDTDDQVEDARHSRQALA